MSPARGGAAGAKGALGHSGACVPAADAVQSRPRWPVTRPACTRHRHSPGYGPNMASVPRKVLILAADDFEDMELLYPMYRLAEEDVEVTVAGLDDHPVRGKKGHGPVPVDTTVERVAEG